MSHHDDALCAWQIPLWQRLSGRGKNLNHGILLTGESGVGKTQLGLILARLLLCQAPQESGPCGECRCCTLIRASNHPDLHVISSEVAAPLGGPHLVSLSERYRPDRAKGTKPSAQIRIDQVRQLLQSIVGKPQIASGRAVIVYPADKMNENASNAILKILEEPPPETWLILITAATHRLPATIRSRCVRFNVPMPAREEAVQWLAGHNVMHAEPLLAIAAGGPLEAARLAESETGQQVDKIVTEFGDVIMGRRDPINCADSWPHNEFMILARLLQTLMADLLRLGSNSRPEQLAHVQRLDWLQGIAARLDLKKAFGVYAKICDVVRKHDLSLNQQALLEDLLIEAGDMKA